MSYKKTFVYPEYTIHVFVTDDQIIDAENDWIDVEIALSNGEHYYPSFFTIKRIQEILEHDKIEGDNLNGLYFWATDQIIIESMSIENILKTIEHLYKDNKLQWMFCNTRDDKNNASSVADN